MIAERLEAARRRTLMLVEPLDEEQLNTVYSPLLSPLAWDLGHIANFEELWLVQHVGGLEPMDGEMGRFYDAIESPRSVRGELPILRGEQLRAYLAEVRERTLEVLGRAELDDGDDPVLAGGFVYEMILEHEQQHNETMLQLLQLIDGYPCPYRDHSVAEHSPAEGPEMVPVDGGTHPIGAAPGPFAYDNERPLHEVELAPFEIDRTPVSSAVYRAFIDETNAAPPMFWAPDGEGGWLDTRFGRDEPIDAGMPVIHVDHSEAAAFAEWAGKRLPTEFEWEAAASGADSGHANFDHLAYGCAPAGAYESGASDWGAQQMMGDVWEWTASEFRPYPGFEPFPYREYSEVFFGPEHRVLRGGSWASSRNVVRPTFRNWDLPERRQIFSGLRCARDA